LAARILASGLSDLGTTAIFTRVNGAKAQRDADESTFEWEKVPAHIDPLQSSQGLAKIAKFPFR